MLTNLRRWLIENIAGKDISVVVNAHIEGGLVILPLGKSVLSNNKLEGTQVIID